MAVGVVQVQQLFGRVESQSSRMASTMVPMSGVISRVAISSPPVSSIMRVDHSERWYRSVCPIASPKLRWLQGGEDKIQHHGLDRRLAVQQRQCNLPAPQHVLCRTCAGNFKRRTSVSWLAPSPGNIQNLPELRRGISNRALFLTQATKDPNEPHPANLTWMREEGDACGDQSPTKADGAEYLVSKLPTHPKLHRGRLVNGLQYVILPNKVPRNRLEARMEMHVGSVDEAENEQGIAHMIEHVAFSARKKYGELLAGSIAYTDFHHTVFHARSPVIAPDSQEPLLPCVLEALHEIAFKPKFSTSRVEKERKVVLSELQMINTMEYRVDCQLLQRIHSENMLGDRFAIGLEEQIKKWGPEALKSFHERWYFPANATLFIVGDIGSVSRTVEMIEAQFASTPAGLSTSTQTSSENRFNPTAMTVATLKERHPVRPPVQHTWSLPGAGNQLKTPVIFQHELLQDVSIRLSCKTPVQKMQKFADLRDELMRKIVLSTLKFRITSMRCKSANFPFNRIALDHRDWGREGCTVTTLTITADPNHWEGAVKVGVEEVRRLHEYGVTKEELDHYQNALLKESKQLAAMMDNVSSVHNLNDIMERDALGHTVMDQQQGHKSLMDVASTVTLADVNAAGAKMLEYVANFGLPGAPLPAAIVACVPKSHHVGGVSNKDFNITPEAILGAISDGLKEPLTPEPELDVPEELLSSVELAALRMNRQPRFVPVTDIDSMIKLRGRLASVTWRRLSNGIRVNYKITQNLARGVLRLVVAGGRAQEKPGASGAVAVGVQTLTEGGVGGFSRGQVELFCKKNSIHEFTFDQDEEFLFMDFYFTKGGMRASFQLLHMILEHNVWLDDALDTAKRLSLSSYRAMLNSLKLTTARRLMLALSNRDERLIDPSPEDIEKLTLPIVREAVMKQLVPSNMEVCVVGDFTESEVESCLLDYLGTVSPSSDEQLQNTEEEKPVVISSSSSPELRNQQVFLRDTHERACAYIAGAVPNRWGFTSDGRDLNAVIEPVPPSFSEERARLRYPGKEVIKGNNGLLGWKQPLYPLYAFVTLNLLAEIIKSRLLKTVRKELNSTYDVYFELKLFHRLKAGWFHIYLSSTPAEVEDAVDAFLDVLSNIQRRRITEGELDWAKRRLKKLYDSTQQDHTYWIDLLAHLQAPSVSRKDVGSLQGLQALPVLYDKVKLDDVYNAYNYLSLDDASLFTCIGVSGPEAVIEEIIGMAYISNLPPS